mgnify:CR=1 FL=1
MVANSRKDGQSFMPILKAPFFTVQVSDAQKSSLKSFRCPPMLGVSKLFVTLFAVIQNTA